MVRHIHSAFRGLTTQIGWSLLGTRETSVGGTEWCFPHLAELVQDIWDFGLVGVIIHKYDGSFSPEYHFRQGRPRRYIHWNLGRQISVIGKSRIHYWCTIIADPDQIGITQKYSNHIVGMSPYPAGYAGEE